MPQQELLTQNELLKQQVRQDTEPLEAKRELRVLNLSSKELIVARSSPAALTGLPVLWWWRVEARHPPSLRLEAEAMGISCRPMVLGLGVGSRMATQ